MKFILNIPEKKPGFFSKLFGRVPENVIGVNAGASLADALLAGSELEVRVDGECVQCGVPSDVFHRPASAQIANVLWQRANIFEGEIIRAGAGEFFARTPAGELHGVLIGVAAEDDVPVATKIWIFIRPEILQISDYPPDENFFPLAPESAGTFAFDGKIWTRDFALPAEGMALRVAALSRQTLVRAGDAFAWAFPEDVFGFVEK